MDEEVDGAVHLLSLGERALDVLVLGHVALLDELGTYALGQGAHPLLQHGAGIGEAQFRAFLVEYFGNTPGNAVLVGDAKNESFLTLEQTHEHVLLVEVGMESTRGAAVLPHIILQEGAL